MSKSNLEEELETLYFVLPVAASCWVAYLWNNSQFHTNQTEGWFLTTRKSHKDYNVNEENQKMHSI